MREVLFMAVSVRHHRIRIVFAVFLGLSVCLIMPSSARPESTKVQNFLRLIQRARKLDEISIAFERAGFSKSEIKELEAAIDRPPYANKLKSLSGPVENRAGARPVVTGKRIIVDRAKKEAINRRATALKLRVKSGPSAAALKPVKIAAKPLKSAPPMTNVRRPPSSGGGTPARITGLNPDPIRVGDRLIITGTDFGSARGSVELLSPESRYICDIGRWSDTRIEATIPGYMDSVIGDRAVDLRLWVKLQATSLGPTRDMRLHPSIREPEVISLSSEEIMPGNEVAIEGRWFYGRGSIEFDFGSQLFRGNIREWTDSLITAGIPDGIGGLQRTRGQIIIRNDQGREIRHPIIFEPDKESVEISSYHEVDRSWKATGETKSFDYFDIFEMQEGWLVRSYRKEIVWGRGRTWYMLEPTPGTTRVHNIITLSAPPFTRLRVASCVTLIGPRGTPYW
jgi:hypothetical protein